MHGSGKTTQAQLLMKSLKSQGVSTSYIHQLDKRKTGDRLAIRTVSRHLLDLFNRLVGITTLGLKPLPKRSMIKTFTARIAATGIAIRGILKSRSLLAINSTQVVIFDRYAYDSFARSQWWYGAAPFFNNLLLSLVPKPSLTIYLETNIDSSSKRHKGQEWSLPQLTWQKQVYDTWIKGFALHQSDPDVAVIPDTQTIEKTHEDIFSHTIKILSTPI